MNRRDLIQKGVMAMVGSLLVPNLAQPRRQVHFIAIGSFGGRILNALHDGECSGSYTWIKDPDKNKCRVPNLNRIVLNHPFPAEYITAHRIKEMPESIFDRLPFSLDFVDPNDQVLLLSESSDYVSRYITPLCANHFKSNGQRFHCIAAKPFSFVSGVPGDYASGTLAELGAHEGKLTTIFADTIRKTKSKLNLAEAYKLLIQRFEVETKIILERDEFIHV